jgi:ERCC4-type nuclease
MLVSPTEPPELKQLGKVSSAPERNGADFLIYSPAVGKVGVQRKELSDLIASLGDRLTREIPLLQRCDLGIVVIEGKEKWVKNGQKSSPTEGSFLSAGRYELSLAQYRGILWSIQSSGLWIEHTNSLMETITFLSLFSRWVMKARHHSLMRRNKRPAKNAYGISDDRDWQIFFLQGLPGVGYDRAAQIIDFYGGLPLEWTGNLTEVPGIGEGTWRQLNRLFKGEPDGTIRGL